MPPVFRFAPSPNGYLHLGHAFSALLNFDLARRSGGRLLLRIEDIDQTRCRMEYEDAIYEDLGWLGIAWQRPVRRQSEHLEEYRRALEKLEAQGLSFAPDAGRGVVIGHASRRGFRFAAKTGKVPMPASGEAVLGGHAVLAVGYDDAEQRFIVRNSWGTGWGMHGYFTIPYAYLTDTHLSSDFWTIKFVK